MYVLLLAGYFEERCNLSQHSLRPPCDRRLICLYLGLPFLALLRLPVEVSGLPTFGA